MHVRSATREDIEAFSDVPLKPTMKAWAGIVDGEVVALGGLAFSKGRWVGFCDLTDKARPYKMTIARWGKRIMAEARKMRLRFVYVEPDADEPTAKRWLESLGFRPAPRASNLYRWAL